MIFYLSKIMWFLFNPFNLIIFFLIFGYCFNLFSFKILSKISYFLSFFLFLFSALIPTGSYLNYLLEKNFHSLNIHHDSIDGILILGGGLNLYLTNEHKQISLNGAAERLTESVILINRYPDAKIVFSGGIGDFQDVGLDRAKAVKIFFNNMNVDINKIYFENKSRNTYENILYSKKLINPKKNQKWLIVSSANHLHRVVGIAENLGWDLIPYPTDFNQSKKFKWNFSFNFLSNLNQFQNASHEWIGIIAYYFMGRSSKIF